MLYAGQSSMGHGCQPVVLIHRCDVYVCLIVVLQVVLTFSMQGLGNFTNTAVLCVLLAIYTSTKPDNSTHRYTPWR